MIKKIILLLLFTVLLLAPSAKAQVSDVIPTLDLQGNAVPFAVVTLIQNNVPLYSAMSDYTGIARFVNINAGTYTVQISGPGITTQSYVKTFGGASNSGSSPLLPAVSDSIQYVSPNGNDTNDGLSMGGAKLTLLAAYNALPNRGGVIYVLGEDNTKFPRCTPVVGQGLGIAGSSDPNYSSMPEVIGNVQWVQNKFGRLVIQGVSPSDFGAASSVGWASRVLCGNSTSPAIWLSNIGNGFAMDRISLQDAAQAIRVGVDSNNSRTSTLGASSSMEFTHLVLNSVSGGGPTVDAGALLWTKFQDIEAANNSGAAVNTNAAADLYFSTLGAGPFFGALLLENIDMTGGGSIRIDPGTGVSGEFQILGRVFQQGSGNSQPPIDIIDPQIGGANLTGLINAFVGTSDSGTTGPLIRVSRVMVPCQIQIMGINQAVVSGTNTQVEGPATVGADPGVCNVPNNPTGNISYSYLTPLPTVTPAAKLINGGAYGNTPYAIPLQRSFNPAFVRFTNLAAQSPSSWTTGDGTGLAISQIQGPGDPTGITNAATVSCTGNSANGGCSYLAYSTTLTLNAGDYIYIGTWMQAGSTAGVATTQGIVQGPFGLELATNQPTMRYIAASPNAIAIAQNITGLLTGQITVRPFYQTDGNWQYVWAMTKVIQPSGSPSQLNLRLGMQNGNPVSYYAPMLVRIPASSLALTAAPTFSTASENGNTVTWTTTGNHKLSGGEPITISGCNITGYNTTVIGTDDVVITTPSGTTFTTYSPNVSLSAPTGCVITPGNDSEAADWANNVSSYSDNCVLLTICGIRNRILNISGLQGSLAGKSSSYTLTASDYWVNVTGTTTITVPHAITGQRWHVQNTGTGTVTLATDSGLINISASYNIFPNQGVELTCDGTNCQALLGETVVAGGAQSPNVAEVSLTAQAANIGATTAYAITSSGAGTYRASCFIISTNTPTNGTTPVCNLIFTDLYSSTVETLPLLSGQSTSQAGTLPPCNSITPCTFTFRAKASTNIQYSTTSYNAGSGTALQYGLSFTVEYLGP